MVMTASCPIATTGVALLAWIALVGTADAFLPTAVTLAARSSLGAVAAASGTRGSSRARCVVMSSEGGATRGAMGNAVGFCVTDGHKWCLGGLKVGEVWGSRAVTCPSVVAVANHSR